jgi:hypothetical protein
MAIYAYRHLKDRNGDERLFLAGVMLMGITWVVAFYLDDLHKWD